MRPVRHHLGITAFGTNAWTAANVGDRLMPEHEEDEGSEELYVVLRGRARFEIDGDTVDAPAGTLVFVPPEGNRTAFAEEPGTTVLAVGSRVGKPYEVGGWEVWAEFHPAYEAGDYEGVIERRPRDARGERLRDAALQPRLLRGTGRPHGGRDRPPSGRLRAAAEPPRSREGGHRPRPASGRAGVSRARRLATARSGTATRKGDKGPTPRLSGSKGSTIPRHDQSDVIGYLAQPRADVFCDDDRVIGRGERGAAERCLHCLVERCHGIGTRRRPRQRGRKAKAGRHRVSDAVFRSLRSSSRTDRRPGVRTGLTRTGCILGPAGHIPNVDFDEPLPDDLPEDSRVRADDGASGRRRRRRGGGVRHRVATPARHPARRRARLADRRHAPRACQHAARRAARRRTAHAARGGARRRGSRPGRADRRPRPASRAAVPGAARPRGGAVSRPGSTCRAPTPRKPWASRPPHSACAPPGPAVASAPNSRPPIRWSVHDGPHPERRPRRPPARRAPGGLPTIRRL